MASMRRPFFLGIIGQEFVLHLQDPNPELQAKRLQDMEY
jgi:hypothetical protein